MPSLTDMIPLIAFLTGTGATKAYYAAWTVQDTDPMFRRQSTQRLRYCWVAAAFVISFAPITTLVCVNGWSQVMASMNEWRSVVPIGWIFWLCCWFSLLSPAIALITARHIYTHPCKMAKSVPGGWVSTRDVRAKVGLKTVYALDRYPAPGGKIVKRFVSTGRYT